MQRTTQGLKYRHENIQRKLRTKQQERGRLDIVSFLTGGLNFGRSTSRGSVVATSTETTL